MDFTDAELLNIANNPETTDDDLKALGQKQLQRLQVLTAPQEDDTKSAKPKIGMAVGAITQAAGAAPRIKALATPENLGAISAVYGVARAIKDVSEGKYLDAVEHAVLGATPSAIVKAVKTYAPVLAKPSSTLEYAKAAGENLNPANIVAHPTVGGAVDQYALSQGQRVVRLLDPSGNVITSQAPVGSLARVASTANKALPFVRGLGAGMSSASSEADALNKLNSPEGVAELSTRMTPDARARLLEAFKDKPIYVRAIISANQQTGSIAAATR